MNGRHRSPYAAATEHSINRRHRSPSGSDHRAAGAAAAGTHTPHRRHHSSNHIYSSTHSHHHHHHHHHTGSSGQERQQQQQHDQEHPQNNNSSQRAGRMLTIGKFTVKKRKRPTTTVQESYTNQGNNYHEEQKDRSPSQSSALLHAYTHSNGRRRAATTHDFGEGGERLQEGHSSRQDNGKRRRRRRRRSTTSRSRSSSNNSTEGRSRRPSSMRSDERDRSRESPSERAGHLRYRRASSSRHRAEHDRSFDEEQRSHRRRMRREEGSWAAEVAAPRGHREKDAHRRSSSRSSRAEYSPHTERARHLYRHNYHAQRSGDLVQMAPAAGAALLRLQPQQQQHRDLSTARIYQRNLLYVRDIPKSIATEAMLRGCSLFGRFGEVISIKVLPPKIGRVVSSAFVTFRHVADAANCLERLQSEPLDGVSRVTCEMGTNKYCGAFIRGEECTIPGCTFIHERVPAQPLMRLSPIAPGQPPHRPPPTHTMPQQSFEAYGPPPAHSYNSIGSESYMTSLAAGRVPAPQHQQPLRRIGGGGSRRGSTRRPPTDACANEKEKSLDEELEAYAAKRAAAAAAAVEPTSEPEAGEVDAPGQDAGSVQEEEESGFDGEEAYFSLEVDGDEDVANLLL